MLLESPELPTDRRFKNITGKKFSRLTVVEFAGKGDSGKSLWLCRCDCGGSSTVWVSNLINGHTRSCGCLSREAVSNRSKTHGLSKTSVYVIWSDILARCNNPKSVNYQRYGGRGIKVCDRWLKFDNFLADMGDRPQDREIDRIDNNGNYEPGNCCWVTRKANGRNKRNNILLTWNGKTRCLSEWAEITGKNYGTLYSRVLRGWSINRIFDES